MWPVPCSTNTLILENSEKDVRFVVRRAVDGSKYIFVEHRVTSRPREKGDRKDSV